MEPLALREALKTVMDEYGEAKTQDMKGHPLLGRMKNLIEKIQGSDVLARHPKIRVKYSLGRGNWARVPWIAFLHEDETTSTQRGIYPVYLFHEEMTFVDLSLNQGFTEVRKNVSAASREDVMRNRAERIAEVVPAEMKQSYGSGARDYRKRGIVGTGLAWGYGIGNILHKEYRQDDLPDERRLYKELDEMLSLYEHVLKHKPGDLDVVADLEVSPAEEGAQENGSHLSRVESLKTQTQIQGLHYRDELLVALMTGLSCQPFILLAGPSGTGKTRLAATLEHLPEYQVGFVEVEGGWLDSASAFGYISPVNQEYVPGPILLQLLNVLDQSRDEATANPILILDELNVSPAHVYLAPLLSVLERAFSEQRTISMTVAQGGLSESTRAAFDHAAKEHSGLLSVEDAGPFCRLVLKIPPTLRVIGTLNFDASTEDLAPKLLSRSFVVWFENPHVKQDLSIDQQTNYNMDAQSDPQRLFAKAIQSLTEHKLAVSTRAVIRAEHAFALDHVGKYGLVDILLSGLVLPQYQTLTDDHPMVRSQQEFLEGLPEGLFKTHLSRMKEQIGTEGMTSVWLVA